VKPLPIVHPPPRSGEHVSDEVLSVAFVVGSFDVVALPEPTIPPFSFDGTTIPPDPRPIPSNAVWPEVGLPPGATTLPDPPMPPLASRRMRPPTSLGAASVGEVHAAATTRITGTVNLRMRYSLAGVEVTGATSRQDVHGRRALSASREVGGSAPASSPTDAGGAG
jgi:hypothetical protein